MAINDYVFTQPGGRANVHAVELAIISGIGVLLLPVLATVQGDQIGGIRGRVFFAFVAIVLIFFASVVLSLLGVVLGLAAVLGRSRDHVIYGPLVLVGSLC